MKILAIDTSSKATSVAVISDNEILVECNLNVNLTHSQTLLPLCKNALDCANITLSDIDCYAASVGPGSFTGLRIGVSAIKGFAFSHEKPCVAVSSLEGLAYNLLDFYGVVASIIEVRRDAAYVALFEVNKGCIKRLTKDLPITLTEFTDLLKEYEQDIYFVGDGAKVWYNELNPTFNKLYLPQNYLINQKASSIALIAKIHYENGEITTAEKLELYYGRLPQAQSDLLKKLEKSNI